MSHNARQSILIIDNDEGVLRAVETRLSAMGYDCIVAVNGTQGLAEFKPEHVGLVITDLNMPAMDGLGVIERLRQRCDVPVIVITGYPNEYARRMTRFYDVAVLAKPFNAQALIDLVTAELALRAA